MKKYYAYVVKDMVSYFESEVAKRDVSIIKRESINNDELYYYELEAEEGIISFSEGKLLLIESRD